MSYVSELLTSRNWNVSVRKYGRDDYLEISKPDSQKSYTIKVKTISRISLVPFHTRSPDSMKADFFVICRSPESNRPQIFVADRNKVKNVIKKLNGDFWLQTNDYEKFERDFVGIKK